MDPRSKSDCKRELNSEFDEGFGLELKDMLSEENFCQYTRRRVLNR